jgi:hypothetical protein
METIQSVPTFVRRQLKVKGKTKHNGRGCYIMNVVGVTPQEIRAKLEDLLVKWQKANLVEKVTVDKDKLSISFRLEHCEDPYYSTIVITNWALYVPFTWGD